jgi:hypothetical protein
MRKNIILTITILIILSSNIFSAMDPRLKECVQRGYEIEVESEKRYCIFPDENKCLLDEFNNGSCGIEYKTNDYCVKEGEFVWDEDKCCKGTQAYLPPNFAGQTRCIKISLIQKVLNQIKYNSFYSLFIILILIITSLIIFKIFRKK